MCWMTGREAGLPVASTNTATVWAMKRRIRYATPITGYGSPYGDYPVPGEEGISGALESRPHLFRVPTVADQESQLYACL